MTVQHAEPGLVRAHADVEAARCNTTKSATEGKMPQSDSHKPGPVNPENTDSKGPGVGEDWEFSTTKKDNSNSNPNNNININSAGSSVGNNINNAVAATDKSNAITTNTVTSSNTNTNSCSRTVTSTGAMGDSQAFQSPNEFLHSVLSFSPKQLVAVADAIQQSFAQGLRMHNQKVRDAHISGNYRFIKDSGCITRR
jgi:hypothetical protein